MTAPLPTVDPAPAGQAGDPVVDPAPVPGGGALARRRARLLIAAEAGMSTAEYAVGTVAACAFAAVLYRVVTGDSVVAGLTGLVGTALATLS